jgi:hypothetical protein
MRRIQLIGVLLLQAVVVGVSFMFFAMAAAYAQSLNEMISLKHISPSLQSDLTLFISRNMLSVYGTSVVVLSVAPVVLFVRHRDGAAVVAICAACIEFVLATSVLALSIYAFVWAFH